MLRKDVKIGLSIGGVLLAVLIVYGIVGSHNKHHLNTVVLDKSGSKTAEPAGGTGSDIPPPVKTDDKTADAGSASHKVTGSTDGSSPSGPVAGAQSPGDSDTPPTSTDDKKGTNWAILLSDDKAGEVARSQTPPLAASDTHTAADSGSSTDHGAATPPAAPGNTEIASAGTSSTPGGTTPAPADPVPPATQPTSGLRTHTVQKGETFSSISKAFYGNARYYGKIAAANPTVNANRLRPGTVINLPDIASAKSEPASSSHDAAKPKSSDSASASSGTVDSRTQYRIAAGDSLYKISIRLYGSPEEVDHLYDLNKAEIGPDRAKLKLGMILKLPAAPTATASR